VQLFSTLTRKSIFNQTAHTSQQYVEPKQFFVLYSTLNHLFSVIVGKSIELASGCIIIATMAGLIVIHNCTLLLFRKKRKSWLGTGPEIYHYI
jgi:tryptophan-rich sensory protein